MREPTRTTDVKLRGKMTLLSWNPHTGAIAPVATTDLVENGRHFTRTRLQLDPVKSVFLVESPTP